MQNTNILAIAIIRFSRFCKWYIKKSLLLKENKTNLQRRSRKIKFNSVSLRNSAEWMPWKLREIVRKNIRFEVSFS